MQDVTTVAYFICSAFFLCNWFGQKVDSIDYSYEIERTKTKIDPLKSIYSRVNEPSLLIGYNLGQNSFGEIGFAFYSFFPYFHPVFAVKSVSTEFRIGGHDFIIGPKLGFWFGGGMGLGLGLNAIYYTNFDNGVFVLKPEVGMSALGFKIFYGYNWNLTNKDFKGINSHQLSIAFVIPFRKGTFNLSNVEKNQ